MGHTVSTLHSADVSPCGFDATLDDPEADASKARCDRAARTPDTSRFRQIMYAGRVQHIFAV